MSNWNWNQYNKLSSHNFIKPTNNNVNNIFNSNLQQQQQEQQQQEQQQQTANMQQTDEKLNHINLKIDEIKKELDILKYNHSTKHIVHLGINCNQCKKQNLIGMRYKCFQCVDYDVCEDCERYLNHFHDNSHFFLRIHDTSLYNNLVHQQQQQQQQQQQKV